MSDLEARPLAVPDLSLAPDPWRELRKATPARVGLGRSDGAMPLREVLDFQFAHAQARDAVHAVLDVAALQAALAPRPTLVVRSLATDRAAYLKRPDLGRKLDGAHELVAGAWDVVVVIADGLSATAVAHHAAPLLDALAAQLEGLALAPIVVATQARVALGDPIGEALGARLCVVLIGERPGLSTADSLGAYITLNPRPGRRDSERNCVSNIHRRGGLAYLDAAREIGWLVRAALRLGATGVALKPATDPALGRDR